MTYILSDNSTTYINIYTIVITAPDSKVHGANMGPIWGRQVPGGPHVGPMNLAIRGSIKTDESLTVLI